MSIIAPKNLVKFQQQYSTHLRSPATKSCPDGIPKRRSLVYEDLIFNNSRGYVEKCFPVAKTLFSETQWLHLMQIFFRDWPCHTPYFSKIPFEFVEFINANPTIDSTLFPQGLPAWLGSLLHYEWLELAVDLCNEIISPLACEVNEETVLKINPTLVNAHYNWPVQHISADNIPTEESQTFLLVFRTPTDHVRFMEINAFTASLLEVFEKAPCTADDALKQLVPFLPHLPQEQILQFGLPLIENFIQEYVLTIA